MSVTDAEWYKVTKDVIQALSWIGAVVGVLVAAFKGITEVRESRLQRERELRWKQANLGREIIDEIFDPKSFAGIALDMLDYAPFGRSFGAIPADNDDKIVRMDDIKRALDLTNVSMTKKDIYIRECFEWMFYYLERLAYFVEIELLTIEDVRFPLEYYAPFFLEEEIFSRFGKSITYERGLKLLNRVLVKPA